MSMREYMEILWRRKWVIIITSVLVAGFAIAYTFLSTPLYQASAMLRVLPISGGSSSDWVAYDTRSLERLINTYAESATNRAAWKELGQRLELNGKPSEFWPSVQVDALPGTELMLINVEAPDPALAADAANVLTEILIAQSRSLYSGTGKTAQEILGTQLAEARAELEQSWLEYEDLVAQAPEDTDLQAGLARSIELREQTYSTMLEQYERGRVREAVLANTLSVVEPAAPPLSPSKPNKKLNIALGFLVGLAGGVGLAFLIESLDTTLYSTEQIKRAAELPILGQVPSGGSRDQTSLFNGSSPQGEAFRRLRTTVFTVNHDTPLHTLLITSAEPREGKSTIAANLAFAVAQSGRKAILVDAHLRMPTLHKVFGLSNRMGLSSVLESKAKLDEAIQSSNVPGIHVLTSGPLPANPAELLSSPTMTHLVDQLTQQFDMVLLDTPSLLAVTDAAVLARNVDGVVLVVERAQARFEIVRAARQQLTDVRANPIGAVVNRSSQDGVYSYYQHTPV